MTKVVYNACFGGFSLSRAAIYRYAELKGLKLYPEPNEILPSLSIYWTIPPDQQPASLEGEAWHRATDEEKRAYNEAYRKGVLNDREISRTDPILVQVVEELGDAANGDHAQLRIEDVPAGTKYRIDEYDGNESVMTIDSYEWETA
jgi:hypothetical protein